jgi:hypothetical protein
MLRIGILRKKRGPYLSEKQRGTVRQDYSRHGNAWAFFSHDQARSRAYRWGEDGIGRISDDQQRLCLALALWNGRDLIQKEHIFGLTDREGITAGTSRNTTSVSIALRRTRK